ncbi:MAG: recombinase [Clostridia bacterium]|nr:recombinase [Clostridia bacterium]
MATIAKSVSSRKGCDGTVEVYFRFSAARGEVYRIKTGIRVPADRWNQSTGTVTVPRLATAEQRDLSEIRKRIEALEHYLTERYSEARAGGETVTREWFDAAVRTFHNPAYSGRLAEVDADTLIQTFIGEKRVKGESTVAYESLARAFIRYEESTGRRIVPASWTADDLSSFENFLSTERLSAWGGRLKSRNSISAMMMNYRTFVRWCCATGYSESNPFDKHKVPGQVYGTPYYLTIAERDALYAFELEDRTMREQRDIFIFQCLVGCRVSDLLKLTKSSLVNGAIEYIPKKTAHRDPKVIRVPLNRMAREIVDRYGDLPGERLLPFVPYWAYEESIKRIFTAAGLTRPVTVMNPLTRSEEQRPLNEIASSHLARRTFIGNLYRQVKDPNLIGALSGHVEGSTAFARYRTIDDEMKAQLVELIDGK